MTYAPKLKDCISIPSLAVLLILNGCAPTRDTPASGAGSGSESDSGEAKDLAAKKKATPLSPIASGGMLTYHNDLGRTGLNNQETILNRTNVNSSTFGKIAGLPIDGLVYAQPLYAEGVLIGGVAHNVLIVATEHDSVYAFDADTLSPTPLWQRSFLGDAELACKDCTTLGATDVTAPNIEPEIGITATPTIDPQTGIIYVTAATKENGKYFVKLHALQLTTGAELLKGPVTINPSHPGTGSGSVGGKIEFDALRQLSRAGLALSDEVLYIGFSSYNDQEPAHGWMLAYNAANLKIRGAWMSTPHSGDGNIWMAGDGPAIDAQNHVYFATGNADQFFTTPKERVAAGEDFADSIVKVGFRDGAFGLVDYFRPFNWYQLAVGGVDSSGYNLSAGDVDLGSGGVMLLPDQPGKFPHLLLAGGKEGTVYVINRDKMGELVKKTKPMPVPTGDTQIVQYLPHLVPGGKNYGAGIYSTPAYFDEKIFMASSGDYLRSIPVSGGLLNPEGMTKANELIPVRGSTPSISANGTNDGLVWTLDSSAYLYRWSTTGVYSITSNGPTILRAYSTDDLSAPLYSSTTVPADAAGNGVKFAVPTVIGGKVFVGTQTEISVYGLRSEGTRSIASVTVKEVPFSTRMLNWIKNIF